MEIKEKNKSKEILLELDVLQNDLKNLAVKKGSFAWIDRKTQDFSVENHFALLKHDIQNKITQRIFDKLNGLQQTHMKDKPSEGLENHAKFEFFLNKENENLKKMIKYQELERKIQRLEKLVGVNQNVKVSL